MNEAGFVTNFSTLDWGIVIVYVSIVVGLGVFFTRYIKTSTDFMVAGRGLKTFLGIATMIGTEFGLVTVMYAAQKGFTGGFAAFHIALVAAVVTLLVGLTGFIVVPLRRMEVMTIPEFYEKRFGHNIRILGGVILAFAGILNMGMFLKAGSLFVATVTGLNDPAHLKIVMTVLLGLVLLYTTLGGMVSVAILDYIQFVLISCSLILVSFISIKNLGWKTIIDTVVEQKGIAGFDPLAESGFGWTYVAWMFFVGISSCAVWQTAVIRACSARDVRTVKRIYSLSSIGYLIRFLIPYFFGISAFVFIVQHEALRQYFLTGSDLEIVERSLTAMPFFLSQILPTGLLGLITAGMLAAFMSTHDSYLLCWSAVLTQDVVAPFSKKELSSKTRVLLTRIFIVGIGIFILVWGLWYPLGQDLWDYMAVSGAIYSIGGFSLLAFGIYWKRASRIGAYAALIIGFGAILGLDPVQKKLGFLLWPFEKLFGVEQFDSAMIGLLMLILSALGMVIGSLLFPDNKKPQNPSTSGENNA